MPLSSKAAAPERDMSESPAFFSDRWWKAVLAAWNAGDHTYLLAELGTVEFRANDDSVPPVVICWDGVGHAQFQIDDDEGERIVLAASLDVWRGFVAGEFKVTEAVLDGRIQFEGKVRRVLPFTTAFNKLAQVAWVAI